MSIEVRVPALPESVADATVVNWHKSVGESVQRDETLVDLETDKVVLEVPAPTDGVIEEILHSDGATVNADDLLAKITQNSAIKVTPTEKDNGTVVKETVSPPAMTGTFNASDLSPAVRRLLKEHDLTVAEVPGSGKDGRVSKSDVMSYLDNRKENGTQSVEKSGASPETMSGKNKDRQVPASESKVSLEAQTSKSDREEKRVPMSRLRARVAERLLQAQHNAAMLTTFNEVNLKAVMDMRAQYKDQFEKKHGVRLGFMSFFTKAVVESLKRFPQVNASIDGNDIVYHGYFDVGIAVSTERGLVVPVIRNVDTKSMANIEKAIGDYALRARDGKLQLEDMQGGTFTITNGGVFGSLLATPILNPPQTGILGMHKIEQRPVVEKGEIVIRPMMYIALSYDHRLIDGKESVQFLVSVKELLEDPSRMLLEI